MDGGTDLLRHARRLIERGWTQHADARAADNGPVHPWDARATSWSLLGALVAALEHTAASRGDHTAIGELAHTCILLAHTVDADSLEHWNDAPARTRNDILAALDRASTLADGRPRHDPSGFSPN